MNKNYLHKSLAALLAAAALTGCAKDKEEFHYIDLSQVACTFQGEDHQPLTVSVITAPAAWSAAPDASWVTAEKGQDGESLTITVEDNTSGTEREARITVSAGQASQQILVTQLAADNLFARLRKLDTFQQGAVLSPSGKYAGGFVASLAPDDSFLYSPTIVDIETGEWHQFGPYPEALHYLTQAMCISDQGLLFITDGMHGGQIAIDLTGEIFIPESPAGFEGKPGINATSADGKYWVGDAVDKKGGEGLYRPLLWTDGVPEVLPMPEKGFREQELTTGVMARGISANGEVAYGTSWENYDFGMLYWKRNGNGFDAPQWVGKDVREMVSGVWTRPDGREYEYTYVNGIICQAWNTQVSPSGKWIAGRYRKEFDPETKQEIETEEYAAFYNTETEKTVIVEDYGASGGKFVTDDGIAFITLGTFGVSVGKVYDLNTGTDLGDTADWITVDDGTAGKLLVSVTKNPTAEKRTASIRITAKDNDDLEPVSVTVTQAGSETPEVYSLTVDPASLTFAAEKAEAQSVKVTATGSGITWSAAVEDAAKEWINLSAEEGAEGETTLTVTVQDNPDTAERSANIILTPSEESVGPKAVRITQEAKVLPPSLSISYDGGEVPEEGFSFDYRGHVQGGRTKIVIEAVNIPWDAAVSYDTGASNWVTIHPYQSETKNHVEFMVAKNEGAEPRSCLLVISTDTEGIGPFEIAIRQEGMPEFLSTLTKDVQLASFSHNKVIVSPNNDYRDLPYTYWDLRFWTEGISLNKFDRYVGTGEKLCIYLASTPLQTNDDAIYYLPDGTYEIGAYFDYGTEPVPWTLSGGTEYSDPTYPNGCWYQILTEDEYTDRVCLTNGTMTVTRNGENYTLTFDFTSDAGYKVTGSFEGTFEQYAQ